MACKIVFETNNMWTSCSHFLFAGLPNVWLKPYATKTLSDRRIKLMIFDKWFAVTLVRRLSLKIRPECSFVQESTNIGRDDL